MDTCKQRRFGLVLVLALLAVTAVTAAPAGAAVTDGRIAFSHQKSHNVFVLRILNPVTGAQTYGLFGGSSPAWGPNGKRLAFITRGEKIAIRNANGSFTYTGVPAWGQDMYSAADMEWSPDGRQLAFGYMEKIWVMKTTRPYAPHQVSPGNGYAPSWSPDSRRILYSGLTASLQDEDLFIVNADGTGNVDVTNTPLTDEVRPDWSPDGMSFAYLASGEKVPAGLYVSAADGSNPRLVAATDEFCCGAPDWSPTGTRIAFIASGLQLAIVNPDGTGERELTGNAFQPAWQPLG